MIDINEVIQWKQVYGDIYQVQILDYQFIFRPLGREEYKQIVLLDHDLGEFQEAICFAATIYPENYDYTSGLGGVAEILSNGILEASGLLLGQAEGLLNEFRDDMHSFDHQVDVLIHEAFREFSLEEIASWPIRKTMFYLSRAEWILSNLKGVPIADIYANMSQEEVAEEQSVPARSEMPPEFQEQIDRQQELATNEQYASDFMEAKPKPAPAGAAQTEEEVLAMLAGAGASVTRPAKDLNDVMPELNWFGYMDELKGEFD
jgi:hypothetical protein